MEAVTPYLVGQFPFININKTEFSKKPCLVGQNENPVYLQAVSLVQTGTNKPGADSTTLHFPGNGQGTYFRQVVPADMQGAYPLDSVLIIDDKIPQLIIEGADGTGEKQALIRKIL